MLLKSALNQKTDDSQCMTERSLGVKWRGVVPDKRMLFDNMRCNVKILKSIGDETCLLPIPAGFLCNWVGTL